MNQADASPGAPSAVLTRAPGGSPVRGRSHPHKCDENLNPTEERGGANEDERSSSRVRLTRRTALAVRDQT